MNRKAHRTANFFDWTFVREALKRTMTSGAKPDLGSDIASESRDIEISILINDIFGGKILKTQNNKGRHFYNRINGKRIDIGAEEIYSVSDATDIANSSASRSETAHYKKHEDYSDFFVRFIRAFEETVGLDSCQTA
ncbi:MAG: hypothetical protein WCD55_05960 [Bacteroidales bacterium]